MSAAVEITIYGMTPEQAANLWDQFGITPALGTYETFKDGKNYGCIRTVLDMHQERPLFAVVDDDESEMLSAVEAGYEGWHKGAEAKYVGTSAYEFGQRVRDLVNPTLIRQIEI